MAASCTGAMLISAAVGFFLGWAMSSAPAKKEKKMPFFKCPHCGEPLRRGVKVCKHCKRTIKKTTAKAGSDTESDSEDED